MDCTVHSDHWASKRYITKYMCGSVVFETVHFDTTIIFLLLSPQHFVFRHPPSSHCISSLRLPLLLHPNMRIVRNVTRGLASVRLLPRWSWGLLLDRGVAWLGASFSLRCEIACKLHLATCQGRKCTEQATCLLHAVYSVERPTASYNKTN